MGGSDAKFCVVGWWFKGNPKPCIYRDFTADAKSGPDTTQNLAQIRRKILRRYGTKTKTPGFFMPEV
jgi:hypothetical protein